MDMQVKQEKRLEDRKTIKTIALIVTFGFFLVLFYLMGFGLPETRGGHDAILLLLGSLTTAWTGIMTYYYGSSAGSERKSEQLQKIEETK